MRRSIGYDAGHVPLKTAELPCDPWYLPYLSATTGIFVTFGQRGRRTATSTSRSRRRKVVIAEKQWDSILASYSEDDPWHDLLVFARARRVIEAVVQRLLGSI